MTRESDVAAQDFPFTLKMPKSEGERQQEDVSEGGETVRQGQAERFSTFRFSRTERFGTSQSRRGPLDCPRGRHPARIVPANLVLILNVDGNSFWSCGVTKDLARGIPGSVGLIGVGLVGTALARRLLAAGYAVSGFDVAQAQLDGFAAMNGRPAASAAEVAAGQSKVILSLPDSEIGSAVIAEITPHLAPQSIVIDTTTGDPDQIAGFAAALASRGVHYIDAALGGSSNHVAAGEAVAICGARADVFADCRDLLSVFAARCFHVGPCGAGARMKLVMNLVLGLNRAVLAEGLSYAHASGVDPAVALEVLKSGPAYSRAMDVKGPKMLTGDFALEARLSQHLKDVRLILETGRRSGAYLPLSSVHRSLLESAEASGFGGVDNSAVIRAYLPDPLTDGQSR
ncbi:MAG: NAD(P)-dependent oxidoreductase [Bryobacteraceae bacterium]